uniref:NAD(P)H dehydrogenase (quinone) n=1 Tax=Ananas comosus var. bracteatus TaxID=296719 RepID=A0A6V7QT07_ANACO
MGKGGGCVPSKKRQPAVATGNTLAAGDAPITADQKSPASSTDAAETPAAAAAAPASDLKLKADEEGRGEHRGGGGRPLPRRRDAPCGGAGADEGAPQGSADPVITALELVEADGLLFGFPTRFGAMAAQMKAFFDSTGQLWREQKLAGKPAGFFVSTGTQGGGQETTAWTAITQLAHHGMLFVPIGYTFGAGMFKMDDIRGGSPYGAGVFAGDGSRQPSETELSLAEHQGKYMASIVKRLAHS